MAEEGKISAKFWASHPSAPHASGSHHDTHQIGRNWIGQHWSLLSETQSAQPQKKVAPLAKNSSPWHWHSARVTPTLTARPGLLGCAGITFCVLDVSSPKSMDKIIVAQNTVQNLDALTSGQCQPSQHDCEFRMGGSRQLCHTHRRSPDLFPCCCVPSCNCRCTALNEACCPKGMKGPPCSPPFA